MSGKLGMSLVLTCYNRQEYIKEAILSVFAQDYDGPMQLIVVDDASTDDSVRIIEETVKEHGEGWDVEIVKLKQNLGVAGATDAGWAKAKHDWILMVDGDDVQMPGRCRLLAEAVCKHPDVVQVSFAMKYIDEQGHEFNTCSYGKLRYDVSPDELYIGTPAGNMENLFGGEAGRIRCMGAAFSRVLWDVWGPLCQDETEYLRFEQDPTLAFRAALMGPVLGVRNIALAWRMHGTNLSNMRLSPGLKGVLEFEKYQEKYQKFHADSIVCMLRDLRRARNDRRLTNWSEGMLNQAELYLKNELNGCLIRYMWWSASYAERLRRSVFDWKKFKASGTSVLRLLPFRLFCWMKYKKQQHDWARTR